MVTARGSCDARALSQPAEPVTRVAPARTLLGNINSHLICVLCRGYYIDATTIVECLHTFCRSCIVKHLRVKSYCPVCEMMINSARPNIKLDKALQDIVYKLVPGLFQKEMARRRAFYSARPHLAADVTPEQRGEDTERVVFSPEDVISFSLEYADCVDDAGSSGSSESGNEGPPVAETPTPCGPSRRYLRCPAVVNISHLKKFLSLKFDIDVAHFFVNILYKRVPLPDYYTLMDIAYIYNWKRIEPMRFFYQITDFTAIRDRFGFLELENAGGGRGPAPSTDPPQSDASSGTSSPAPDDASCTKSRDSFGDSNDKDKPKDGAEVANATVQFKTRPKSPTTDVEKSQFLNSFELTAKCSTSTTTSPVKDDLKSSQDKDSKSNVADEAKPIKSTSGAVESDSAKRKSIGAYDFAVPKKIKTENSVNPKIKQDTKTESSKSSVLENLLTQFPLSGPKTSTTTTTTTKLDQKPVPNSIPVNKSTNNSSMNPPLQDIKRDIETVPILNPKLKKTLPPSSSGASNKHDINAVAKKCKNSILKSLSLKRKLGSIEGIAARVQLEKCQIPTKLNVDAAKERQTSSMKIEQKPTTPVIPNKSIASTIESSSTTKPNTSTNVNTKSDPNTKKSETVKESQKQPSGKSRKEGDPLQTLFDSCNINIPSSLSITLTDLKMEQKQTESPIEKPEVKKPVQATSNLVSTNPSMQISSQPIATPPDKNYLEIIKLPDVESATPSDSTPTSKSSVSTSKSSEPTVSAKGPVPNLKPISEAKIVPFSKPQTFQQTFLQSLQQQKEKPKFNKNRLVHPKLGSGSNGKPEDTLEATLSPKPGVSLLKPQLSPSAASPTAQKSNIPVKSDSALDLSTPHTVQTQLGPQQAKALKTMQSIEILAKKQCLNQRSTSSVFSQDAFKSNPSTSTSLRVPVPISNNSHLKLNTSQGKTNSPKHFPEYFQPIKQSNVRSPSDCNMGQTSKTSSQSTPISHSQIVERSQTRSPSSSPKLIIACPSPKSQSPEQKQFISPRIGEINSQSNLISSSNVSSTNVSSNEPSGSKDVLKMIRNTKPQPINKLSSIRGPSASCNNMIKTSSPSNMSPTVDILRTPQMIAQQAYLRQQLELQTTFGLLPPGAANQWLNNPVARAHFENIMKNMTHNNLPFGNNQNSKDK